MSMKKIRIGCIVAFFILLFIPVATFNREEHVVSTIDNRILEINPFEEQEGDERGITERMEAYAQDRIGLRNEMISAYTRYNDVMFHEMVHPTYAYGQDDYVFMQPARRIAYEEYHVMFAQMVANIQQYCQERDVPFLFVFNPSKSSVLTEKLGEGYNYNNDWVALFEQELDRLGVHYIDNTDLLIQKAEEGEEVFNKQYDAGHWNDLGAFYGVNNILETLGEQQEGIHINTKDEFNINSSVMTSLLVSDFPINDEVQFLDPKVEPEDLTEEYKDEVQIDELYNYFLYTRNEERKEEGSPKALVFQGSYMNVYGSKFMANSLGEYIAVHDYHNVMNFDYYYNIFQPDCVVFEVAEHTMNGEYFNYSAMEAMDMNPALSTYDALSVENAILDKDALTIEEGKELSVIHVNGLPENSTDAYIQMGDRVFDLMKQEDGSYAVTVENSNVDKEDVEVITVVGDRKIVMK